MSGERSKGSKAKRNVLIVTKHIAFSSSSLVLSSLSFACEANIYVEKTAQGVGWALRKSCAEEDRVGNWKKRRDLKLERTKFFFFALSLSSLFSFLKRKNEKTRARSIQNNTVR